MRRRIIITKQAVIPADPIAVDVFLTFANVRITIEARSVAAADALIGDLVRTIQSHTYEDVEVG